MSPNEWSLEAEALVWKYTKDKYTVSSMQYVLTYILVFIPGDDDDDDLNVTFYGEQALSVLYIIVSF